MSSKAFRLFVSSTFSDFVEERQLLNDSIYKELENYCQQRGYDFQIIDLRWGVNSESALNQKTMNICLNEVSRCLQYSPKPNFLIMLGERYGWVPLPATIPKRLYEKLQNNMDKKDRVLLSDWYEIDDNAINGEYYLLPRKGQFVYEDVWENIYFKLHGALKNAAANCDDEEVRTLPIAISATEQEIIEGLFNTDGSNVCAVFRKNHKQKDVDTDKVEKLKTRIKAKLGDKNILSLDYNNKDYFIQFKSAVVEYLKIRIDAEIKRLELLNSKDSNQDALFEFFDVPNNCLYRDNESHIIDTCVNETNNTPILIYGEPGSGKSTLLAEYIRRNPDKCVFSFWGMDSTSGSLLTAFNKLFDDILRAASITKEYLLNYNNIERVFKTIMESVKGTDLTVIIDGLDMFYDIHKVSGMVLPANLSDNIHVIISYADRECERHLPINSARRIEIDKLNADQCELLLRSNLLKYNRTVSEEQLAVIKEFFQYGATPLTVKLIVDKARQWKSSDSRIIIPQDDESIALEQIEEMFNRFGHDQELTLHTVAIIAAHPYGISERALLMLLMRQASVKYGFSKEDRYNHKGNEIPFVIWSRLFYDLSDCLRIASFQGKPVVKFYHNIFRTAFLKHYQNLYNDAKKILLEYYLEQSNYVNEEGLLANTEKAMVLPILLLQDDCVSKIKQELEQLSFSDILIKSGELDTLLLMYNMLMVKQEISLTQMRYYQCIRSNQKWLRCYRNCFLTCCYEIGLVQEPVPVLYRRTVHENKISVDFPYSPFYHWDISPNANRIAVVTEGVIAIYHLQLCYEEIQISVKGEGDVRGVHWLENDLIAVIRGTELSVFCLAKQSYHTVTTLSVSQKNSAIVYHQEYHIMYYFSDNALHAYSVRNNKQCFTLPIPIHEGVCMGICDNNKSIFVYVERYSFSVYEALSGSFVRTMPILKKRKYFDTVSKTLSRKLFQIDETRWILYVDEFILDMIDYQNKKRLCFNLPMMDTAKDVLLTDNKLFLVCQHLILSVDFTKDFSIKYFHINDIVSTRYVSHMHSLGVMTISGFYIISDDSFISTGFQPLFHRRNFFAVDNSSPKPLGRLTKRIRDYVTVFAPFWRYGGLQYETFNIPTILRNSFDLQLFLQLRKSATMITTQGKSRAVAYEYSSIVEVYDALGYKTVIERLRLGIDNSILDMAFSQDEKFFYLRTQNRIVIINVANGKCLLQINVSRMIIHHSFFQKGASEFIVKLADEREFTFSFKQNHFSCSVPFPTEMQLPDNNLGPKLISSVLDGIQISLLAEGENGNPTVSPCREYCIDKHAINYFHGKFILWNSGDEPNEYVFTNNCFFNECRSLCLQEDSTLSESILREKNDFSGNNLILLNDRFLLLVSYTLNSVIIFDLIENKVLTAYRHHSKILGYEYELHNGSITLYSNVEPYKTELVLNL